MSLLALQEVRVAAGGSTILDLSLTVEPRGVLAVLGPTGAGKSTLLRVANLLERPAAGWVEWQGARLSWPAPLAVRRQIAMAFQAPLLFSGTVFENVAYGLELRGEARATVRARVGETLSMFHIEHLAGRRARTLSGGEAQRVSLARAVVLRPRLLLLDEPLASLDTGTRAKLRAELAQVIERCGLSCLFVTHDLHEAMAVADRVAVLDHGRLLQVGTTEDVFCRPTSKAVAEFVHMENILSATVVGRERGLVVVDLGGQRLRARTSDELGAGERVLLCVRPEQIWVASGDQATGPETNRLVGTICRAHDDRAGPFVELAPGGRVLAALRQDSRLAEGDTVCLELPVDALHVLRDPEAASC